VIPVAIWPVTWHPSLFLEGIRHWGYYPQEYFLGALTTGPIHYYLFYFLATAPLLMLFFFLMSFRAAHKKPDFYKYAILMWFFVHLVLQSLVPTVRQDGMRYILIILPAFALLAGIGFNHFSEWFKQRTGKNTMASVAFLATIIYLIAAAVSIHPYYLDYYNEAVGGAEGVQENKLFEIGWWGEGISETADFVSTTAPQGSSVTFFVGPADHLVPKLRPDLDVVLAQQLDSQGLQAEYDTDYIVTNNFYLWYYSRLEDMPAEYKPIYTAEADGAALATVYRREA